MASLFYSTSLHMPKTIAQHCTCSYNTLPFLKHAVQNVALQTMIYEIQNSINTANTSHKSAIFMDH